MSDTHFKIIDATKLPEAYRSVLRPGEEVTDREGKLRVLPRYFYEVPDWQSAVQWEITEHFALYEFLMEDIREAEILHKFPKYVPTAVTLLAAALEVFRDRIGKLVHISANGGYRSPVHKINKAASVHSWGSAANIYRIGDEYLDNQDAIEKYSTLAKKALAGVWTRPFGHRIGEADDHLHIDIGFVTVIPRNLGK